MNITTKLAVAGMTLFLATPVMAHGDRNRHVDAAVYDDSNSRYLDYKTDLSEARRELRSDLARANDEGDRIDAWAEYRREVADARHDFAKEMAERGVIVQRRATVTVED